MAERERLENVVRELDDSQFQRTLCMVVAGNASNKKNIRDVGLANLKRLNVDPDPDLASDIKFDGECQRDYGSLFHWMSEIEAEDRAAITQLKIIHATALVR